MCNLSGYLLMEFDYISDLSKQALCIATVYVMLTLSDAWCGSSKAWNTRSRSRSCGIREPQTGERRVRNEVMEGRGVTTRA
jgi:hypothetical protein